MSLFTKFHNRKKGAMGSAGLGNSLSDKKQTLTYLGGSIHVILAWPVICALLGAVVWGVTISKLNDGQENLNDSVLKQATSLSKTYAEQLARSIEQIDQITLNLAYYWQKTQGTLKLEEQLKQGLYPASAQLYVTIVDRNGARVTSTLSEKNDGPTIAQRRYFQIHQSDPSKGLLISGPAVGLRTGKMLVRFTRRLDAVDGSFGGVVIVSVEPGYLASVIDESSLGKNDFLSVRTSDGTLLAKKMGENIRSLATTFRTRPVFESDKGVVAMPKERFIDGQPRVVAWQMLKSYPLVAMVGLSEEKFHSSYQAMSRDYRYFATAASAFLLLAAVIGMFFSSRLAWRKQQADNVKNTYRMATDGAREGFYMVRALYGQNNDIVDFLVEDCNERGASYYGTTRSKLVGTKFSDLSANDYLREVLRVFRCAMENGFYEDEFKVSPLSPLQVTWIHRRLVRSADGLAVTLRDISETKANEETLSRLANADTVTTLPNRHWLMNFLPMALTRARNSNTSLALLFLDLDDFKNINDTLGHAAGDELLQAVAFRLKFVIRPEDNVVRLGGDEFTIILEQVEGNDAVSRVAERIVKTLSEPFLLASGNSHTVHGSVGISIFPQDGDDVDTLLKHADIAMYAVKAKGKAHYQFFHPQLSESLVARLNKEQALRNAIEHDELVLYYQPRVDTFSGELRGMEALVRWMHPERGLIPPLEFIPLAEETGLIVKLGELVIEKACAQLARWKALDLPVVPVSINVSPRQFNQGNLSSLFSSCMARHDIDASLIEMEITESCMLGEDNTVTKELAAIEALDIKLLVDDFGTGYSSLSQLQRLDLDVLKVDRAFTTQICNEKGGEAFFKSILAMAHVLGMRVVAEGVETEQELRVLQALSCNEIQGYFISRPVPAEEVPSLLLKRWLFPPFQQSLHAV